MKRKLWFKEGNDRRYDPASNALISQLTGPAYPTNNYYCEQPYCSSNGKRIVATMQTDPFYRTHALILIEIDMLSWCAIEENHIGLCTNAYSGTVYYWVKGGKFLRFCLETMKKEVVFEDKEYENMACVSARYDQNSILFVRFKKKSDSFVPQIIELDIKKGRKNVIFEHPEILNSHAQYEPVSGNLILIQNNRGMRADKNGSVHTDTGSTTTLFVIDRNGKNLKYLPVGEPYSYSATGHECFIPGTDNVVFTTTWDIKTWKLDSRYPDGNVFVAKPGDEKPQVFPMPEHRCNHISVSRCGRYFVADSYVGSSFYGADGNIIPLSLVVGNLQTKKYRTLVENTMASGGGSQSSHPHPYFTSDNKNVIFNADFLYSNPRVFACRIPEGFLESLD